VPDDIPNGPDNPAGFIRGLLAAGEGPTAGLRIFRDAGGAINDSRWFNLYSQVNDTAQREPGILGMDPFTLPSTGDYGDPWVMGRGGQFATQVEIQVVDRDTNLWFTKQHTYITDEPHTPAEAEADAFDTFGDPDVENEYGEVVMGAIAVHMWTTTPYGDG
jgi:hypothetical protein